MKFKLEEFRARLRKRLPRWINLQNLIFISVIMAFIIIVAWSEDISQFFESVRFQDVRMTATPTVLPGTPTPLPAEWLTSAEQTNGIVFGAVIILVAILAGVAAIVLLDRNQ
jgi:hypothetical protein